MSQLHEVVEGIVGALYHEKSELDQIIRSVVYTVIDEKTAEPLMVTIQSFYQFIDDELGARYYDDKGLPQNIHALALSFSVDKYDGLMADDIIHEIKDQIYEYFSALESYVHIKKIHKKLHDARNESTSFVHDYDQNKLGR